MLSTVVLGAALLAACSPGSGEDARGGDGATAGTAAEQPAPAAADAAEDDAAACVAFGDVLTIVENADVALAEGRMAAQEQQGWYALATRVLGRLPSGGGTDVQTAIGALQAAAPAAWSTGFGESTGVRSSPGWSHAEVDLATACDEVGSPLAISMFTGG